MQDLAGVTRWVSEKLDSVPNWMFWKRASGLFVTEQRLISKSQIFPYYFYRDQLARELDFTFRELPIDQFHKNHWMLRSKPEIFFVQPWWDIKADKLLGIFDAIRQVNPEGKIVFLDGFAPLDLRLAALVNDHIDVYVKKHVFRDRTRYGMPTKGDTNLTDFYGSLYGLQQDEKLFPVPAGFLQKLIVGPTFATARFMLPRFSRSLAPPVRERIIDLHARLGGKGDDWYGKMRDQANREAQRIPGIRTLSEGLISHAQYMQELESSKICFSPFGFGEVCWRDYEAILSGALLIKPELSHVETLPDIFFRPYESYVPVRWDYSDLEEKVRYYLDHEAEREVIIINAYSKLRDFFVSGGFVMHVREILNKAGYS